MVTSQDTARLNRLLKRAARASVLCAVLLAVAKFVAWRATGSLAILASLADSLMDGAASAVNLAAIQYSLKDPDEEHRFGHGKAEALAGLGQSVFIGASALFLIFHAIPLLTSPRPLAATTSGLLIMLLSLLATGALFSYQRYVVHVTDSAAIRADSLHYGADLLTNLGGIAALGLSAHGIHLADPIIGILIALFILASAYQIGRESLELLMDRELPAEFQQTICDIAMSHPEVKGIHDLRTRRSGRTMLIQFHLDMDDLLPLAKAHAVSKAVERKIIRAYPTADIIIHQDPAGRCPAARTDANICAGDEPSAG